MRIGRYIVLGTQGEGGMGTVYEAFDRALDRRVAVKILRRDIAAKHASRLVREARALARLSHPNVVQVYEVGEVDGQTFVAMELIRGATLQQWCRREPNPDWQACVELYWQAGQGLAAAHERGLVHRDFKPSNAIVDAKGRVRVVDFGLARTASDRAANEDDGDVLVQRSSVLGATAPPQVGATLTETGLVMGTPAYMPLEQMRGQDVDARGDQFSFCVALYEAVYRQRPYAGWSFEELEAAMCEGRLSPVPMDTPVPSELHEVLVRGLSTDPDRRWPSMDALLGQLQRLVAPRRRGLEVAAAEWERLGRPRAVLWSSVQLGEVAELDRESLHPNEVEFLAHSERRVARGRLVRRAATLASPAVLAAIYGLVQFQAGLELEQRVDERLDQAAVAIEQAMASRRRFLAEQAVAYERYDSGRDDSAREAWARANAEAEAADLGLATAARELERALTLDPDRSDARARLGDALLARAELAERRGDRTRVTELIERLALYDESGERMARWNVPARLSIETTPSGAAADLVEYRLDGVRRRLPSAPRALGQSPIFELELAEGSYRLELTVEGRPPVVYPLVVGRGEFRSVAVEIPPAEAIPAGFVYVPAGRFLVGCRDETLCDVFYDSVPIHSVSTDAYLIGQHEVTYGDWIEFLDGLPAEQRADLIPRVGESYVEVSLDPAPGGGWMLSFPREGGGVRAGPGELLTFAARDRRTSQPWWQLPVLAISFELGRAYLDWLDHSGRVPGARYCTDHEWERAGRGADGRLYPHGDHLDQDDINIDTTYGRNPLTWGPDVVGSHPASRSPFGVDGLSGNAGEWTVDALHGDVPVLRGGSFMMDAISARVVGRQLVPPEFMDGSVGLRICASFPLPRPVGEPEREG